MLPGGESTTLGLVAESSGLLAALRARIDGGLPALGTCAGMIVLARATTGGAQPLVGGMDIVVRRNAFGRQVASFEAALQVPALGPEPVDAVFIRAPWIEEAGPGVEVLAAHAGHGVAARQGDLMVTAFHPELSGERRFHEWLVGRARARREEAGRRGGTVSGHSKWATIKRKKGAADAKRGQLFSKLSRAIIVAAKEGGADPESNTTLANAIQKARDNSMPKDNIERAIQRGAGGAEGDAYESMVYEGYAPGGVAVIATILTDNRNRTASDLRHIFTKNGGSLGTPGRRTRSTGSPR